MKPIGSESTTYRTLKIRRYNDEPPAGRKYPSTFTEQRHRIVHMLNDVAQGHNVKVAVGKSSIRQRPHANVETGFHRSRNGSRVRVDARAFPAKLAHDLKVASVTTADIQQSLLALSRYKPQTTQEFTIAAYKNRQDPRPEARGRSQPVSEARVDSTVDERHC